MKKCPVRSGLIEFMGAMSQGAVLPLADFQESEDRAIYCMGFNFITCNGVIEKNGGELEADDILRIMQDFKRKKFSFVWWTDNPVLDSYGFQFGGVMKGIVLNTPASKVSIPPSIPEGIVVKKVETEQQMKDFVAIFSTVLELSSEVTAQFKQISEDAWQKGKLIHYIAYAEGKPVATATLSTLPKRAGIWNCTTLPEYRKKGIQSALCAMAVHDAQQRNYKEVIATLTPKGMAWNLFQTLGFKEVSQLPFYVHGIQPSEVEK